MKSVNQPSLFDETKIEVHSSVGGLPNKFSVLQRGNKSGGVAETI